jgi:hypothetical protein
MMLTRLGEVFRAEPVLCTGLVTAFNGVLALFVPDEVTVAVSAFNFALAAIVVRMLVTPLGNATKAVQQAAAQAASEVANNLTPATVGVVGEVTEDAGAVVADAASVATRKALQDLGLSRNDAKAAAA